MTKHKEPDDEQLTRRNNKQPSIRHKWYAFQRLWRLSIRDGMHRADGALGAWRIWFTDWSWVWCMEGINPMHRHPTWPAPVILRQLRTKGTKCYNDNMATIRRIWEGK